MQTEQNRVRYEYGDAGGESFAMAPADENPYRRPPARAYAQKLNQTKSVRETIKEAVPQIVHLSRLARFLKNQVKFPIAGLVLDWDGRIHAGPFAGMRFPRGGGDYSEVLGAFEYSLIPVLEQVIAREPDIIVDVGAAWGYYAMGLAYRSPKSRVIAYEMDSTRFDVMRKFVHINNLADRVAMGGECTVAALAHDLRDAKAPFLFMDAEGAESYLLEPDMPNIDAVEMLVELHEVFVPGITDLLKSRFATTHVVSLIDEIDMSRMPPPENMNWFVRRFWSRLAKEERDYPTSWMHLVPRTYLRGQASRAPA